MLDFLLEKWKLYGDQCLYNLSLLPPPTELVCNRTFDKYACWPDTPLNTTANVSCPWYLPWHHTGTAEHGVGAARALCVCVWGALTNYVPCSAASPGLQEVWP